MLAIRGVTMLCLPAKPPVKIICHYDKNRGRNDKQQFVIIDKMIEYKQGHAC